MNKPPILVTAGDCAASPKVRAWSVARGIACHERNASDDPDAVPALHRSGTFATALGLRPDAIAAAQSE